MNSALISTFLCAIFLFCCPDHGWTYQAENTALLEMETKMTNILARMERFEAYLETIAAETGSKDEIISSLENSMERRDQRIGFLEVENRSKEKRIATLENKITAKEEELMRLRGRMTETEETGLQLRELVDKVRNPPFAFQCAWQNVMINDNSVITYDRLTYDDISGGSITDASGGMNISTGVFTVGNGFSGVWSLTFSIKSYQNNSTNEVYIFLNGQQIVESRHLTYNFNTEDVGSLGSRTLHMRLEEGDQVTLRTMDISWLYDITICFELAHPVEQ